MKATIEKEWIYLKIKHKSSCGIVREHLAQTSFGYLFLSDLPDNRACCMRLKKDFFKHRLLVQASRQEVDLWMNRYKEHIRYVGEYGKAAAPVPGQVVRQLALLFDKLDRDFIFENSLPAKAKPYKLPGGNMAGVEGRLEYRGVGGYRLYVSLLDLCMISFRVDKQEMKVIEKQLTLPGNLSVPRWYVLRTRREQYYYDLLLRRGYKAYLPMQKIPDEAGGEKEVLIMRGYLFFHLSPINFRQFFSDIPGSSDRLLFNRSETIRTPLIIPDKQLEDFVYLTEHAFPQVTFAEEIYQDGDPVSLLKTGFEGIEGKLVKRGGRLQVFISLASLASGYLIPVEKGEFRKIGG